jgi:protoporphyrinogen oxidase
VVVLEKDPEYVGGIARTVRYKNYRFDIGGHRFFSKSPEITAWWARRLPNDYIRVRRLSRIFYRGVYFDYPLRAANALFGLGVWTSFLCMLSYLRARLFPIRPETSFADWVTNRFGSRLFHIFFKTYTEKVWGMPCSEISADWAAQRIKGLSLLKAVLSALLPKRKGKDGQVVKTLIDAFDYPRLGPGMMWEKTRDDIRALGHEIAMGREVVSLRHAQGRITAVVARTGEGGEEVRTPGQVLSTLPLQDLVRAFDPAPPEPVRAAADRLRYRDFLTVALMVRRDHLFPDNWIYVHDPTVRLGRIQNFNNWSPEMVPEPGMTCLGLEYFCFEGDDLWTMADDRLIELGKTELDRLGLVRPEWVTDGCVVRMEKAYPVYGPGYQNDVRIIRDWLATLDNLQVAGRNGMHKYNNQDHSMMTALLAARNILGENFNVWNVNTDAEYHEDGDVSENDTSGRLVPRRVGE